MTSYDSRFELSPQTGSFHINPDYPNNEPLIHYLTWFSLQCSARLCLLLSGAGRS